MKNIFLINLLLITFSSYSQMFTKELIGATTSNKVNDIKSIDIDGDGLKDIVALCSYPSFGVLNNIIWYKNLGDGSFKQETDISQTTTYIAKIFTIDFDQDGDFDILSSTTEFSNDSKIFLHRNIGGGEFGAPELLITSNDYYFDFYSFDIDNDGFKDIISYNGENSPSGPLRCYRNLGNGSFASPINLTGVLYDIKIKLIKDLDNDSMIDLIIKHSQGIDFLKNLGNMNFTSFGIYYSSFNGFKVNCRDLNLDGETDIILSNYSYNGNPLSWIENFGNGNFASIDSLNTTGLLSAGEIRASDFDNDGDMDIACHSSTQSSNKIEWFENDGFFNFSPVDEVFSSNVSQCDDLIFLTDDVNSDGNQDVVIAFPNLDRIEISYNNQSAVFQDLIEIAGQTQKMISVLNFDVDNDNDLDLISVNYNMFTGGYVVSWYENIQNGEFSGRKIITRVATLKQIKASDINLDGRVDLLVSVPNGSFTDKIICFENQGNGNFGSGVHITTSAQGETYYDFEVGDLNNDGFPEIVYDSYYSNRLYVHENLGNLSFSSSQTGPSTFTVNDLSLCDVNNDGYVDAVYSTSDGYIACHQNLGNGTLGSFTTLINSNSGQTMKFKLSDIDSDLDLDLIYGIDSIFCSENDGSGNFQNASLVYPSFTPESVLEVSDLDGDGDKDIICTNSLDGSARWIENDGLNGFNVSHYVTTNEIIPAGYNLIQKNITCFDLDNDSDQEIFIACRDSLVVMRNNLVSPNQVSGTIFYDENQNGIMDTNDFTIPQIEIATDNGGVITYSNNNGGYFLDLESLNYSTYQIAPQLSYNWQITNNPQTYGVNYNAAFVSVDSVNFGIYPSLAVDSVEASLTGGFPRCNDTINYWLNIMNVGSTIASGVLQLELDDSVDFYQSNIQPDSVVGNDIYWSYDSLYYYQNETITIQVILPDFNSIGDTLSSTINGDVYNQLGNSVYHSESEIKQMLVCAYDPNDKMSAQAKFDPLGYIPVTQEYLDYTVRFQNTGNDTARVVVIKDQLDSNLVWNSISTISSSHEMDFNIDLDGLITFTFNDIYLPDSNVNFNGSQGCVKFRIGVKPNLLEETKIHNYARIYFDQNPAVLTNTRINTIDSTGSSLGIENPAAILNPISIYPNPFNNTTTVDFGENSNSIYRLTIYDIHGRKVFNREDITERKFTINERDVSKGLFIVFIQNNKNEFISSHKIICR